jgi:hypothetical protein
MTANFVAAIGSGGLVGFVLGLNSGPVRLAAGRHDYWLRRRQGGCDLFL